MWFLFYLLLLLALGVCVGITMRKIKRDPYNPYYLQHTVIGYAIAGAIFVVISFVLLLQV